MKILLVLAILLLSGCSGLTQIVEYNRCMGLAKQVANDVPIKARRNFCTNYVVLNFPGDDFTVSRSYASEYYRAKAFIRDRR